MDKSKAKKSTPLVIHGNTESHARFTHTLKHILESKYYIKYHKDKTEVFTTQEDYKKLKEEYQNKKIEFHTYTLHNERKKTFVIRGLHAKMEEKEITDDLAAQGLPVTNVHVMKGTETPLYMISLPATMKRTLLNHKIHYICHIKVTWEDYKTKRRTTQCHRYQEWGHATSNCYAEPACLKCAEKHLTKDCPKPRDQPARCVNCDGDHPANATICEAYKKRIEWIASKSKTGGHQHNVTLNPKKVPNVEDVTLFPSMDRNHNQNMLSNAWTNRTQIRETTYASRVAQPRDRESKDRDELNEILGISNELREIKKLCNIKEMLEAVKELRIQLSQCKTKVQQLEVFIEFCDRLDG